MSLKRSLIILPRLRLTERLMKWGVLITLKTDPADMGKVIGRSGNTAKAIRTLLRVVGMKNNARVNLKIEEPEGSTRPVKTVDQAMDDLKI